MSANKKYFTINFINLIHRACHMLSNFTNLPVSALIFHTLTPNMPILFTVIPLHITSTIHCIRYTSLLKTLHSQFWWDALLYHYDPHWLNTTFSFLGL